MRDKFELHCKTVGLIFFCIGAYSALTALPLFFHKAPDATQMIPGITRMIPPSALAEMQAATSHAWKYALETLILTGIAPILLGLYLMRSNNIFLRRCYSAEESNMPEPSSGDRHSTDSAGGSEPSPPTGGEKRETNYAPAGYFSKRPT